MTIEVPEETAAELRAMLRRRGEEDDIEAYVQRTLQKRLLFEAVTELRLSASQCDPDELRQAIEEARIKSRPADRSEG